MVRASRSCSGAMDPEPGRRKRDDGPRTDRDHGPRTARGPWTKEPDQGPWTKNGPRTTDQRTDQGRRPEDEGLTYEHPYGRRVGLRVDGSGDRPGERGVRLQDNRS